jgi:nodulation protein E
MHRVAITGLGCLSPLGHTAEAHWRTACDGRSAIATMTKVDPAQLKIKVAAEIRGFDPLAHFDERLAAAYDPFSHYAVVASRQAVADAGLDLSGALAERTAVVTGTGIGGAETIDVNSKRLYGEGARRVHPNTIPKLMPSAATSHITLEHGIYGPGFTVTSACSSANHAIGEAFWMVRSGRVTAALTGGSEAILTYGSLPGWQALRVMDPVTCRPFDRHRQGMVLGEGAGILVLEELEHARRRGARIYAELAGFGLSSDAESILEPSEPGAVRCIKAALDDAGLNPDEVDYVNAHGTGTQANDVNETRALCHVFGDHAANLAVTSTKSMHGHALGAAGALEAVLTVRAISDGVIPPTANHTETDPDCTLDYVPNEAREQPVRAALTNSFAFGGLNAVLAMRAIT